MSLHPCTAPAPASPALLSEALAVVRGEADERTLTRVVMDSLMIARASATPLMRLAWINVAMRSVADWRGERTDAIGSLTRQVLAADAELNSRAA